MAAFNKFFASVFLAIVCASSGLAAPWPASLKHATNRLRITFGEGIEHPLRKRAEASIEDRALAFIQAHLDVPADAVSFKCGCAGEVSDHVFVWQAIDGIPVANALTNVAFNKDDKVVVFGSSFVPTTNVASSTPIVSLEDTIASAEQTIDGTFNEHPPTLQFLALEVLSVRLTHIMQIQNSETNAWLEAFVDAHTGDVLSLTDFVTKAMRCLFNAMPAELIGAPTAGTPTAPPPPRSPIRKFVMFTFLILCAQDHGLRIPSPDILPILFLIGFVCSGNNTISFKGAQTATTAQSAAGLVFNYPQSATTAPTTTANINAARVNAFYMVNSYGFTEAAFNFQNNNFGKGGARNDRITISVQNSAGIECLFRSLSSLPSLYFAFPFFYFGSTQTFLLLPSMLLWDLTNAERDGALENNIGTHEVRWQHSITHIEINMLISAHSEHDGITNPMTGGGTGRCLQTTEAGGMGEGRSVRAMPWLSTDFQVSPGIREGDIDLCFCSWNEKTTSAVPHYVLAIFTPYLGTQVRSFPIRLLRKCLTAGGSTSVLTVKAPCH
ncbi:hypothetical protein B0H14DRAFT_3655942 [Mycena olivaceomarginata]|nr:hypothetical protein B0H14DRAFT_3655942 [Mycena olivaceomarginata]